ncbi:MAG: SusC/RagA family TonB-linked outer membrane protein [Candidatus Pedobacter colombiensis]|uniref:SusC/RagA family TonB-linked outer membrane protein n=1 Tax=Candidatus Pedobacter colombiensis TaxID=3121371 RepID=A0AAJ5W8H9_9SPHI|nr:SusC/RagA family TonB-linked outer membrane protein [Pedobacter sp.]WEK19520.1 MAG: SusC/RagA family TonB-linked outer membrane protein [Pedobacter sp.]
MKKKLLMLFLGVILLNMQVIAQQITVTGKVTSSDDGLPIPGVSVKIKDGATVVQTNPNGIYSIKTTISSVLVFSYIGMVSQEKVVASNATINVVLVSDAKSLQEVVVTALGIKQQKRSLGYATQEISAAEITNTNQSNVLNALKGKASSVQVTSAGGSPGAGSRIQIRGINSLNPSADNQPLFVVDGIPISNSTDLVAVNNDNFQNTNRAADINPEDIETMTILKGPAASVLYGLRAANGAIVITTKSGKAGKPNISFKSSYSFDDVTKTPPIQTTYGNGNGGAFVPSVNTWGPRIEPGLPVYNPYDVFFKTGHQAQNSLSISGGNETATYFTSIANSTQKGVVPNSDYGKVSVRLAGTLKASDKLKFEAAANYINSGGKNPRTGITSGTIFYLMRFTNTVNPADYLNPDGTEKTYNSGIDNPFYFSKNAFLRDNVNRILGNLGAEYKPNDWLSFNYKVGIDNYSDFRQNFLAKGLLISTLGAMTEQRISYSEINSNFFARATKKFGDKWSTSLLLGHSYTHINRTNLSLNGAQAVVPNIETINNYNVYTTTTFPGKKNIIGVFGDLSVSYDNTVFLSATGRNDWSSTLPQSNRSFFYPSASLSYVFTETLGLQDNPIFNYGKLRASYAEVGKDADPYQIGVYYSTLQAFNGVTGIRRSISVGSEELRPERTKGLEFGGEFHFLRDRITLDANYAILNSIDQIVPVPISYASGYDLFITNAGKIRNRSLEFLATATVLKSDVFKWDLNLNWSQTKGRVLSMPPGVSEITFNPESPWVKQIIKTGGRPGDWYGWPYTRVTDGSASQGQLIIGADGYPIIPQPLSNNYLIGNAYPNWIGGLGSTVAYKGFTFSFLFNFRKGGDVFDIPKTQRFSTGIGAETELRNAMVIFKGVKNTGTDANPVYVPNDKAVIIDQAFYANSFPYKLAPENNGFQDASWIRLQNISLSYDLPRPWLSKLLVKSASVSVTANNLWLNTKFIGFDPEASAYGSGSNSVGYVGSGVPSTRSIYLGLNVNF